VARLDSGSMPIDRTGVLNQESPPAIRQLPELVTEQQVLSASTFSNRRQTIFGLHSQNSDRNHVVKAVCDHCGIGRKLKSRGEETIPEFDAGLLELSNH
jgi:hypothetical protein